MFTKIDRCITDETEVFQVVTDGSVKFDENNFDEFDKMVENISSETGVPQDLVSTKPIDRWHKINGEWYYLKRFEYDFPFLNELLGEIISEYFDLDTIHYNVAQLHVKGENKGYGVISKNFCDVNTEYKTAWDYNFNRLKNISVLKRMRRICESDEQYALLLDDMKKFFIRDFYAAEQDRSGNNILFKNDGNGPRLAPLYDYEDSFTTVHKHIYRNQIAMLDISKPYTRQLILNDDRFQELFNKLMDINMKDFIDTLEERHKILVPEELKGFYNDHDTEVKGLVLKNKIVK